MELCCHTTVGTSIFDGIIRALKAAKIKIIHEEEVVDCHATGVESLRKVIFISRTGKRMAAEEYVEVDDQTHNGISLVATEIYPDGQRPDLESRRETVG